MKNANTNQTPSWGSQDFSARIALFIENDARDNFKRPPIYVTQGEKKPRAKRTNLDPYPKVYDSDRSTPMSKITLGQVDIFLHEVEGPCAIEAISPSPCAFTSSSEKSITKEGEPEVLQDVSEFTRALVRRIREVSGK